MKKNEEQKTFVIEWQPLKVPLILLSIGIIVSGFIVILSNQYYQKTQETFERTDYNLKELQKQNEESLKTLAVAKTAYPKYIELKAAHFFDNETALLNWASWLESLQKEIKIPKLNYEFNTQQPITIPVLNKKSNVEFFSSEIKLTVQILHMGDFFNLIQGLKKHYQLPLFNIKSCEIKRKNPPDFNWQQYPGQPLLEAVCTLQWYSAKLKPQGSNK